MTPASLRLSDTIAAIATPPGEGGIGIVRLSGNLALPIADRLFHAARGRPTAFRSHTLHYGRILDPESGELIDDAVLGLFRGPRSYTGEDVVELSCHGGPATLGRVLQLCLAAGARAADPGEFTQRAFLNGRMDLAQAEAVCDQIRARTDSARRLAVRQREGALSREIQSIRHEVVGILASVEVTIDFSDEVGDLDYTAALARIEAAGKRIETLVRSARAGRLYREGIRLTIAGRPNAGKSSLLNALTGRDRAIVTAIPGTTRDAIEEAASIEGIPITAVDTAGIRETEDEIERIGIDRAFRAIETAAVVLLVVDASVGFTAEDRRLESEISLRNRPVLRVLNKMDLPRPKRAAMLPAGIAVSAVTGDGIPELKRAIAAALLGDAGPEESLIVSNARHQHALESALESLRQAADTTRDGLPPDFISIDLRGALDALGQITGESVTDEIIHRIFEDFCVGK